MTFALPIFEEELDYNIICLHVIVTVERAFTFHMSLGLCLEFSMHINILGDKHE